MTTLNYRDLIDGALYTKLNVAAVTDLADGPYNTVAPNEAESPYVLFSLQSMNRDDWAFDGEGCEALYLVKVVFQSGWPHAQEAVDTQIIAALHDQTLTVSGGTNIYIRRQTDIRYSEEIGGRRWWHCGGSYKIICNDN